MSDYGRQTTKAGQDRTRTLFPCNVMILGSEEYAKFTFWPRFHACFRFETFSTKLCIIVQNGQ